MAKPNIWENTNLVLLERYNLEFRQSPIPFHTDYLGIVASNCDPRAGQQVSINPNPSLPSHPREPENRKERYLHWIYRVHFLPHLI
jgi:hypothetical protein